MPEVLTETDVSPCPACGDANCFDHQLRMKVDAASKIAAERARLERLVIEAAKKWYAQAIEHDFDLYPEEQVIANAVKALIAFEESC